MVFTSGGGGRGWEMVNIWRVSKSSIFGRSISGPGCGSGMAGVSSRSVLVLSSARYSSIGEEEEEPVWRGLRFMGVSVGLYFSGSISMSMLGVGRVTVASRVGRAVLTTVSVVKEVEVVEWVIVVDVRVVVLDVVTGVVVLEAARERRDERAAVSESRTFAGGIFTKLISCYLGYRRF